MLRWEVTVRGLMIPRMKLSIALVVAISACAKPTARSPSPKRQETLPEALLASEVEAMADKAAQLLRRQQELIWQSWISGKPLEVEQTYQNTEALFSLESIRRIEKLRQALIARFQCTLANDGVRLFCSTREGIEQIRAVTYLHMHFVGEYLSRGLEEQNRAIANLEASLSFSAKGREYPYRDLERLLTNENSPETRHGLYLAATREVQTVAGFRAVLVGQQSLQVSVRVFATFRAEAQRGLQIRNRPVLFLQHSREIFADEVHVQISDGPNLLDAFASGAKQAHSVVGERALEAGDQRLPQLFDSTDRFQRKERFRVLIGLLHFQRLSADPALPNQFLLTAEKLRCFIGHRLHLGSKKCLRQSFLTLGTR